MDTVNGNRKNWKMIQFLVIDYLSGTTGSSVRHKSWVLSVRSVVETEEARVITPVRVESLCYYPSSDWSPLDKSRSSDRRSVAMKHAALDVTSKTRIHEIHVRIRGKLLRKSSGMDKDVLMDVIFYTSYKQINWKRCRTRLLYCAVLTCA